MAKNFLEQLSKIALFRAKETSLGNPQNSGGVSMDFDSGSGLNLERRIEDDRDMVKGVELGTRLYYAEHKATGKLSQKRVKPDFLTFVLAFFFGECSTTEPVSGIYQHIITPKYSLEIPSFTLVQRRGDSIIKERYSGNLIDSFTLELGENWVSLSAEVRGIGKRDMNYYKEVVKAPANSTQISLSANGVEGATEAERVENIFRVRAKDAGESYWKLAKVSGVSATVPAVISFREPIGSSQSLIDFHIDYIPKEPNWCSFPEDIDESPLRLVDSQVIVDGYFNGDEILGGDIISNDLLSFTISGQNHLMIRQIPDGSCEHHAKDALRSSRDITIKLSERLRSSIRQYQIDNADFEYISVCLKIRGAEIVPGSGYCFGADLIFPRCGIVCSPVTLKDKFFAEDGDLLVLYDETYKGVYIRTWNKQTGYL